MSKPVKELVRKELIRRFEGVESLAVVDMTGVDAVTNGDIRSRLRAKGIHVTVVKNSAARHAFRELGLKGAAEIIEGPSAIAYGRAEDAGVVTVVRELLEMRKDAPTLTVKAALLEGEVFGPERIEELSQYPTRQEAIGRVVQLVLSPGKRLGGCLMGPGGKLASLVKALEEKQQGQGGGDSQAA